MLPLKISTPVAVLVLAGAVVVSATTGAVAGSLVTGAQIKNESLTGKDVKNGTIKAVDLAKGVQVPGPAGPAGPTGPAGVNNLRVVTRFTALVDANTAATVTASCPVGQKVTGGTGWWFASKAPVQFVITDNLGAGVASSTGVPSQDLLIARVICVPATVVEDTP